MEGVSGLFRVAVLIVIIAVSAWLTIRNKSRNRSENLRRRSTPKRWHRGYVAAPGEQIYISVRYIDRKRFDHNGQVGYRYRFRDERGHCLVWFTSYSKLDLAGGSIRTGSVLNITAIVARIRATTA